MKHHESAHRRKTDFICLYPRLCDACWNCIEICPMQVLGKIDFIWHRHVVIQNAEACNGCKKCVRACQTGALEYTYMLHSVKVKGQEAIQ